MYDLSVSLLLDADTPIEISPVQGHPDSAVVRIGSNGYRLTLHVCMGDVERLTAALSEARDLLQANALPVAA
jgi:hypothetical protein